MKKWALAAFGILFSLMFCFNCFGYAALSANLVIYGDAIWTKPDGVVIMEVTRNETTPGDGTWDSSKTSFTKSILTSNVVLTNQGTSSVTLSVTVRNYTDVVQGFDTVIDGKEEGFYSNEDIVYTLTNLERKKIVDKVFYDGTQIQPGAYHTFEITFSGCSPKWQLIRTTTPDSLKQNLKVEEDSSAA